MLWILFSCCCVFPIFQCGNFGYLSLTCTKPADTLKRGTRCDWVHAVCWQLMMLMPSKLSAIFLDLLSSCSDEFIVKGGSNGVKGRLRSSPNFWVEALNASDFVLDMIRRGYRLPFAQYLSQCFLKNNRSPLQHPELWPKQLPSLLVMVVLFNMSFLRSAWIF